MKISSGTPARTSPSTSAWDAAAVAGSDSKAALGRARKYSRSYLHWRGDEKVYRAITFDRNRAATADHQTGRRPPHGQCWVLAGVAHPWRGAARDSSWLGLALGRTRG